MNDDHAEAVRLYATKLLGAEDGAWRLTGLDPEGLDLARGDATLRLPFPTPCHDRRAIAQSGGGFARKRALADVAARIKRARGRQEPAQLSLRCNTRKRGHFPRLGLAQTWPWQNVAWCSI
jgi:hypothetical protein